MGLKTGWRDLHIKTLVPIGIQGLPDDAACVGLLCIHRNNCERVWKTKDFALGQAICSDDYGGGCEEHSLEDESGRLSTCDPERFPAEGGS